MKKVLLGISLIAVFGCGAKKSAPEKLATAEFQELLLKSQFYSGAGAGFFRFQLSFKSDMSYIFEFAGGSVGWKSAGIYKIEESTVTLTSQKCESDLMAPEECQAALNNTKCFVRATDESLDYSHDLVCNFGQKFDAFGQQKKIANFEFPVSSRVLPPGAARKWQGVAVITMGHRLFTSTAAVRLRDKPSVSGTVVEYVHDAFDGKRSPTLPKGTKVIVHARTKTKDKVGDIENYWFLLSVDANDYVWAFAEYFAR